MLRVATATTAAARRLLPPGTLRLRHFPRASFSTAAPPPVQPPQTSPSQPPPPPVPQPQKHGSTAAAPEQEASHESASAAAAAAEAEAAAAAEDLRRTRRSRAKGGDYEDEQAPLLKSALGHVRKLGWCESALMAGARDVGLSPSIVAASFRRKEAALVEFFMDDCLEKLIDRVDSGELDLSNQILSERLSKLIRIRLEMQIPYMSKWAQALSIQTQPMNIPTSLKQRIMLVDEIWHASGDETSDIDWYVKRTILSGIYSASEVYMLTDTSPEFCDTWTFLDNRIKDAFDIQKTAQEATYIAEAVGTGVGNSMQDFMKTLFKGFKV